MAGDARRRGSLELRAEQTRFTRRVYLPVQEFIHIEWVGSAILFAAAVAALAWANSPWAASYHHLWETHLGLDLALFSIDMDLHHWINDGLMALFFFVVGLEIKRELLRGELAEPRKAALPMAAAAGGMVVPALLYAALNRGGQGASGWGIPMATDIAFALGVLGLLGRRVPTQLRVFLLALAIVDDLGAILVIAVFYTAQLSLQALGLAALVVGGILILRAVGVRSVFPYAVLGFLLWAAILESGVHATLAGVVLGALTPARPSIPVEGFRASASRLVERIGAAVDAGEHDEVEAALGRFEELTVGTEAPLERMERRFHPWTAYVVLPLFALANAGVALSPGALSAAMGSTVTLGVGLGLVVGKVVGVVGAAWLAVATGLAVLPPRIGWRHVAGAGLLAGIGFTVALFIAQLAFTDPVLVDRAKIGILVASVTAGVGGWLLLRAGGVVEE